MFSKIIKEGNIPPNFLNSILTNPSLYDMFKNEYEENREYFQGLEKEEYLSAMIKFIEDSLFSSNIFNIFSEPEDLEEKTKGRLAHIRNFYDDFLLDEFRREPESILKTKLFRGMAYAKENDIYASKTEEFNSLFDYVFHISLDYDDIVEVLLKEPISKLSGYESLSLKEFDTLCNYVKNNVDGIVPMSIVTKMLKNHAFKTNHIFDREVVKILVQSTAKSYLEEYGIPVTVEFTIELDPKTKSSHDFGSSKILLSEELIEQFLSLNYIEIFEYLFMEAEFIKDFCLLKENRVNMKTLKVIMNAIVYKVDLQKIFDTEDYRPVEYLLDTRVSSFIKSLRFFSTSGVNLFSNYIRSKTFELEITTTEGKERHTSSKEISLDQRFFKAFKKTEKRRELIKKFAVLGVIFDKEGNRLKTIDIIKKTIKNDNRQFLEDYLHSRVVEPEVMIEDVMDLAGYKSKDLSTMEFIERELKYIYTDTFYYSLDSYLKMNESSRFDRGEYLDDILVKVNCIKDTPLTHRFIDEALFVIEEMKQNV